MDVVTYRPLVWLLLVALLVPFFVRGLVERPRWIKLAAFLLRCAALALIVLAMCRPFASRKRHALHVIHLLDVSESVDLAGCEQALERIQALNGSLRPLDSSALFVFADSVRKAEPDSLKKELREWREGVSDHVFRKASRIAESLEAVRMTFPSDKGKRIVLHSDGHDTGEGLRKMIARLRQEGIEILYAPIPGIREPEAYVSSLAAGTQRAYCGEKVRLTAKLSSNRTMRGRLRFVCRGVVEHEKTVQMSADSETVVHCDVAMDKSGSVRWRAELIPEQDRFPANNQAECVIEVSGKARILVLHKKPAAMRHFARALRAQGFDVETRGKFGLPESTAELLDFDAIVFANLAGTDMNSRQMVNVRRYVTDFGGGFVMLGSENSFGLGGYYRTPIEDVLPIVSRYEKEKEKPSLAIVLVLDKSGSMSGEPIDLARQAAKAAAELLSPQDRIAVLGFDSEPFLACDMTSAADIGRIHAAIDSIAAAGGTNMFPAMQEAQELLERTVAKLKHCIILSDGMSMPGDFQGLTADMAANRITVSTVAFGQGADRQLLSAIAQIGRGRYYETLDAGNVPRIFTKETVEASRSAIIEKPFAAVKVGNADLLDGIDFDECPYLLGYVMTRLKPTAQVQLVTQSGDPLLAVGNFGLGRALAFTSGAGERWAGEWVEWRGFGKFWAQLLRYCVRKSKSSGISVRAEPQDGTMRFVIDRRDELRRPLNGVKWNARVANDFGLNQAVTVRETGLGLYEATVELPELGHAAVWFHDTEANRMKVIHHQADYPREYLLQQKLPDALRSLSAPDPAAFLDADALPTARLRRPVQHLALLLAMAAVLAGIILRRLPVH